MDKIRIALIEDQQLFRNGIYALLKEVPEFDIWPPFEHGTAFTDYLLQNDLLPDIVLADMNMPGLNGFELTQLIHKKQPEIRIIILTIHNQEHFISKMIEAGVGSYLVKNCELEEVILAIRTVYKTGFYFNETIMQAIHNSKRTKGQPIKNISNIPIELTERELQILRLICAEHTNAEIGDKLHISSRTVDGHRNNLLAKTGCKNTAGLVMFAVRNNIVEEDLK